MAKQVNGMEMLKKALHLKKHKKSMLGISEASRSVQGQARVIKPQETMREQTQKFKKHKKMMCKMHQKMHCKMCKTHTKTKKNDHDEDDMKMKKHLKRKKSIKMTPPSKGHKPKGAHGRAVVEALGRTKTTGNFARIEKAKGKGAAINAFQNALRAHKNA